MTGTGTGVGKTLLTALVLQHLRSSGVKAAAMKPFACGSHADARLFQRLQSNALPPGLVNPFYFSLPVAPLVAASQAGRRVTLADALGRIIAARACVDVLLVEGCGGLLTPLGPGCTLLELAARLKAPVVIAARNRLGVLNDALLTVESLRRRGVGPLAMVLMGCARPDASAASNPGVLARLAPSVRVLQAAFLGRGMRTAAGIACAERRLRRAFRELRRAMGLPCGPPTPSAKGRAR